MKSDREHGFKPRVDQIQASHGPLQTNLECLKRIRWRYKTEPGEGLYVHALRTNRLVLTPKCLRAEYHFALTLIFSY